MKPDVLYEDNHLIAVYKPAGILTQGEKSGDANVMDEVKKYLKEKYHKPGSVFLGLLHRLDRPVSGIILFAKTSKGASRLSEQFRNQTVEKIYHALVSGKPKQNRGVLVNYLRKDEKRKKAMILKDKKPGANLAKLFYEVVASNIELSRSEGEESKLSSSPFAIARESEGGKEVLSSLTIEVKYFLE